MARTPKERWTGDVAPPNNPFGALAGLRDSLASAPEPSSTKAGSTAPKGPARAVVRREKTGRGGREVTVVSHLGLAPVVLDDWQTTLKRQLGCGGQVEEDRLVFHGDQRERLEPLLLARGVAKVTQG
jgi:translation initiation factor 1